MSSHNTGSTSVWSLSGTKLLGAGLIALSTIGAAVAVGTPAGTTITNIASATYFDENGNDYDSTSPPSTIQVDEVYSATIFSDETRTGAPGATVYFPHVLTNTGNAEDIFNICGADFTAGSDGGVNGDGSTDSIPCTSFQIHRDGEIDGSGNGVPDSGEQLICDNGAFSADITLPADSFVNLVVSCVIPAGAGAGQEVGVTIEAEAENGTGASVDGSVDDITNAGNGIDTLEDTNNDIATVTFDASITEEKESAYVDNGTGGTADDTIDYTLTVGNNGGSDATSLYVYDFIDPNFHDVDLDASGTVDAADAALFAAAITATGADLISAEFVTANGLAGDTTTLDLGAAGASVEDVDITNPYALPTLVLIVRYDTFEFNNTREITFNMPTIDGLPGGTLIPNEFFTVSNETAQDDSNDTVETVPNVYAGTIGDTAPLAEDEDGGVATPEDDNDRQTTLTTPHSGTVDFHNVVTNNSNVDQCIDIEVIGGTDGRDIALNYLNQDGGITGAVPYPAGTTFTLLDTAGQNPLSDNCVPNGIFDTGSLAPGESFTITVRAELPSGVFGAGPYTATVISTVAGAPAADKATAAVRADLVAGTAVGVVDETGGPGERTVSVWDIKAEVLNEIEAPSGDLSNGTTAFDDDPLLNAQQYGNTTAIDLSAAGTAITVIEGALGDTVVFPLTIENDSGEDDTFQLSAGGSIAAITASAVGDNATLGALPPGWTVEFRNTATVGGGLVITSTVAIPSGEERTVFAHVTIPSIATQALADVSVTDLHADINGDGSTDAQDIIDGGALGVAADADGDYAIFFKILSLTSGATDVKLDGVDVTPTESVILDPNNSGTVQPGGSITYNHTLANNGNTDEIVELSTAQTGTGWTHTILLPIDDPANPGTTVFRTQEFIAAIINGGGSVDLVINDPVAGTVLVTSDAVGPNGNPLIALTPGQSIPLLDTVNAPANAADGDSDTVTITATYNIGDVGGIENADQQDVDSTQVQLGQVRLVKRNALDADCDGVRDAGLLPSGLANDFRVDNGREVAPGQCIIWEIVAKNEGTATITDLVVTDASPDFTSYIEGTTGSCNGGTTTTVCTTVLFGTGNEDGLTANAPGHFALRTTNTGVVATTGDSNENNTSFRFFVGTANVGDLDAVRTEEGGDLAPNAEITMTFSTRVE